MTRWQFLFRKGEGGLRNKIGEGGDALNQSTRGNIEGYV